MFGATSEVPIYITTIQAAYNEILEVERHLHNAERWLGIAAPQTATDWAANNLNPFIAISGNNTYGADLNDEALILGTDDTPVQAGMTYFDLHRIMVVAASQTSVYKMRIIWGTGTMAAAIGLGQYSETLVRVIGPASRLASELIMMPRLAVDTQIWGQCWNAVDNATISFLVGLHEYPV